MKSHSGLFRLTHVAWLTVMMLFFCNQVTAQCPPANVALSTQAEVDQFISDYPGCTQIKGYLAIAFEEKELQHEPSRSYQKCESGLP